MNFFYNISLEFFQAYWLHFLGWWWAIGFSLLTCELSWKAEQAFIGRTGFVWAFYRFVFARIFAPLVVIPVIMFLIFAALFDDSKMQRRKRKK